MMSLPDLEEAGQLRRDGAGSWCFETRLTFATEAEVDNRLIDTYRKHQQHIEPNGAFYTGPSLSSAASIAREWQADYCDIELKATLAQSLQAKVASLEDDKWMFEVEDPAQVEML